jgi:hypothetical protein
MPHDFTRYHYCHKNISSDEIICATESLAQMGRLIGVTEEEIASWIGKRMPLCQECIDNRRIWRPAKGK